MSVFNKFFGSKSGDKKDSKKSYLCSYDHGTNKYIVSYLYDGEIVQMFDTERELKIWIEARKLDKENCIITQLIYPELNSDEV